jgi:hypothetical protein
MAPSGLWATLRQSAHGQLLQGRGWGKIVRAISTLLGEIQPKLGLIASHCPVYYPLPCWTFTTGAPLLPYGNFDSLQVVLLPHQPDDFLLVLTPELSIVVVLNGDETECLWSWHPEMVQLAVAQLATWLSDSVLSPNPYIDRVQLFRQHGSWGTPQIPDPQILARFHNLCMVEPDLPPTELPDLQPISLLAHEVHTCLATILTLNRSIQKRSDLPPVVQERLQLIHQECTVQLQRFKLLEQAAHLQQQKVLSLEPISIEQLLSMQLWQEQAHQRQVHLHLNPLPHLPKVLSHRSSLESLLNGLVDYLLRTVPTYSHIYLTVTSVGLHLKSQFQVFCPDRLQTAVDMGNWFTVQPDTGSVNLNLATAKAIVQILGGRLTVRSITPTAGNSMWAEEQVLTLFLPVAEL